MFSSQVLISPGSLGQHSILGQKLVSLGGTPLSWWLWWFWVFWFFPGLLLIGGKLPLVESHLTVCVHIVFCKNVTKSLPFHLCRFTGLTSVRGSL